MPTPRTTANIVTGIFCVMAAPGAVMDIIQPEILVTTMAALSLPLYLPVLIGIWKILGIVALAAPVPARIREWAYAGFFFDLTGAAWCHGASGDWAGVAPPLVILAVGMASMVLRDRAAA